MWPAVPPPVASVYSQCSFLHFPRTEKDQAQVCVTPTIHHITLFITTPSMRHRLLWFRPRLSTAVHASWEQRLLPRRASWHCATSTPLSVHRCHAPVQPASSPCLTVSPSVPMSHYIRSWFTFCCLQHMVTSSPIFIFQKQMHLLTLTIALRLIPLPSPNPHVTFS